MILFIYTLITYIGTIRAVASNKRPNKSLGMIASLHNRAYIVSIHEIWPGPTLLRNPTNACMCGSAIKFSFYCEDLLVGFRSASALLCVTPKEIGQYGSKCPTNGPSL